MNNHRPNVLYLLTGVILLFSIACSALSSFTATEIPPTNTPLPTATSTPIPTSTPLPNYDGVWKGTTSQGKVISITVENNTVTSLEIEADMDGNGCTTNAKGTIMMKASIVEGAFEASVDIADATYAIRGNFDSETSASGTFQYSQKQGCPGAVEVEWSASKNASEQQGHKTGTASSF